MARTVKALIFKCGDLTANIAAVCSARSECPPLRLDADEKTIEITVEKLAKSKRSVGGLE